jgi:hypothetical protein
MNRRILMAGLMTAAMLAPLPVLAHADIGIGINLGPAYAEPPPPVVYQQPYYVAPPPYVVTGPGYYGYGPGPYYRGDPYWRYHHRYYHHYRRD